MNKSQKHTARQQLQKRLDYTFRQPELLQQALTHRSAGKNNNERLEFVGDGIVNFVVAQMLYHAFPDLPEGRLSVLRTHLVKEAALAEMARELGVGAALTLGVGELKSGGHDRPSILADALEALFAAIRLDADLPTVERIIQQLFNQRIAHIDQHQPAKDNKTRLQEALQACRLPLPKYRIEKQTGEGEHAQFDVSCDLGELGKITYAHAHSRREAEQECARQALLWLEEHQPALSKNHKKRR